MYWKNKIEAATSVFYVLSSLCLSFVLFFYLLNSSCKEFMTFGSWIYYMIACLSRGALFCFVPFALIAFPLRKIGLKTRLVNIILLTLNSAVFVYFVINYYVFNIYKFHINSLVLSMLFGPKASDIFVFDSGMYLKAAGLISFIILLTIATYYLSEYISKFLIGKRLKIFNKVTAYLVVSLIVLTRITYGVGEALTNSAIVESSNYLPYYATLTMKSMLDRIGLVNKKEQLLTKLNYKNSFINYPIKALQVEAKTGSKKLDKPMNIIILGIDSWNPRTYTQECTPNIWNFGQKAIQYSDHIASSNNTKGGLFGFFTGIPGFYWRYFQYSTTVQPVLTKELLKANYSIQVYPSATFVNPPFFKMFFSDVPDLNLETKGNSPYERDHQITENFLNDLDKYDGSKPMFSFVFYDLAHAISIPKEKQNRFQPSWEYPNYMSLSNKIDPLPFFNLYRNCVAEIDSLIGKILEKLEKKGMLQNSVIIIMADHGQEFNENKKNYWGHFSNFSEHQTKVPFIYYYPDCKPQKVTYRTSHYDVSPTLLKQVLSISNPPEDYSYGAYLTDSTASRDWLYCGVKDFAYILTDGTILEKRHSGLMKITDKNLNHISNYRADPIKLNAATNKLHRFLKK